MEDLRSALEYLTELGEAKAEPQVVEINGRTYCNKSLQRYEAEALAYPIGACSLKALVEYLVSKKDELSDSMIIHVENPGNVRLISGLKKDRRREQLLEITVNRNGFMFNEYYDQENFVINMQTAFQQNEDRDLILAVAGKVENKSVAVYGDDGCSQKATISSGIAGKQDVIVPNPVTLKPYRTFLEVDQPSSKFIFRIKEGSNGEPNFKLVEADGGMWKYEAVAAIKEYIANSLPEGFLEEYHIAIIG